MNAREAPATQSLAGIVVGIPAARRSDETAALVRRWGGEPLVGPVMREVPVSDDTSLRKATEAVITSPVEWSIHLTGVGTSRWFDAAAGWGLYDPLVEVLRRARVIPRGAKSARVLSKHNLTAEWIPPGETSEEIGQWVASRLGPSEAVALQIHGAPVKNLTHVLKDAGARVVQIAPYRWDLPEDLEPVRRLVAALVSGAVHVLLITSAPQIRHLLQVAREMGQEEALRSALAERVFIAAVGTVAGAGIEDAGLTTDLVADPPRMGALIRTVAGARDGILAKNAT